MPKTEAQLRAQRKYREKNKEKIKLKNKEYWEKNKEEIINRRQEYIKSIPHLKSKTISRWKDRGIIDNDYDKLYDYYINCNNCEKCNIELCSGNMGSNKRCLDHDHETGLFRYVLCNTCNYERWK